MVDLWLKVSVGKIGFNFDKNQTKFEIYKLIRYDLGPNSIPELYFSY